MTTTSRMRSKSFENFATRVANIVMKVQPTVSGHELQSEIRDPVGRLKVDEVTHAVE